MYGPIVLGVCPYFQYLLIFYNNVHVHQSTKLLNVNI